jgi:hypothetical protein
VGYKIEQLAIETAAPYLPELKQVLPEAMSAVMDLAPPAATLSQMVLYEKQIGAQRLLRELKEAEQRKPGSWQDVWKEVFPEPAGRDRELRETTKTFDQALQMVNDSLPYYDRLAKIMDLSWKEADGQVPELFKKADAQNRLTGYLLPAMGHVASAQCRTRAYRALFEAALAVVQGGPNKLQDVEDPFGEGPFELRPLFKGFELRSKLLHQGTPITLTVGQRK